MKNLSTFIITTLLLVTTSSILAQGPWLYKKNDGYLQIKGILPFSDYTSTINGFFGSDSQNVNRASFNSDYNIYLEYGLIDKLDVIAYIPFKYIRTGDLTDEQAFPDLLEEGSLIGLSNTSLGFKYALIEKDVKVAVLLDSRWNTIAKDLDKGLATGYDANAFGVGLSAGISGAKFYTFLASTFYKYTNDFSDVVEINFEFGRNFGKRWNAALALNSRLSLYNGDYSNENLEQTAFYPNDQEWAAVNAKVAYQFENGFGINTAFTLFPIYFNRVGGIGTVALGIFKKF